MGDSILRIWAPDAEPEAMFQPFRSSALRATGRSNVTACSNQQKMRILWEGAPAGWRTEP